MAYRFTLLIFFLLSMQPVVAQDLTLAQADSLHDAGKLLYGQGDLKKAAATFQLAMEAKQSLLPQHHIDIRGSAANLGLTRWKLEEFWASIGAYRVAAAVESAQEDTSPVRLGNYYNTIGPNNFNLGLYDSAHYYFHQAKRLLSIAPQEAALLCQQYSQQLVKQLLPLCSIRVAAFIQHFPD